MANLIRPTSAARLHRSALLRTQPVWLHQLGQTVFMPPARLESLTEHRVFPDPAAQDWPQLTACVQFGAGAGTARFAAGLTRLDLEPEDRLWIREISSCADCEQLPPGRGCPRHCCPDCGGLTDTAANVSTGSLHVCSALQPVPALSVDVSVPRTRPSA